MEESDMAEGVVESKEEMKKKMEKKKKEEKTDVIKIQPKHTETPTKTTAESDKTVEVKEKLTTAKEDTKEKLTTAKEGTEEKLTTAKEGTEEKLGDMKEGTRDTWGNVQDNLGDFRDEASARFEEYRKESERTGRNPAEMFLSDIFAGIRQKTEDANKAVRERTTSIPIILPLTDIIESNTTITIISDIPGLEKENIDVGINQMTIEITATYKEKQEVPGTNYIQKERGYGVVHRVIELPSPIDVNKTTANYKNCTLTMIMPKKERDVTKIKIQE
jgi:HSP20 family protein